MIQTWIKINGTNDSGCRLRGDKITAFFISKKHIAICIGESPWVIDLWLEGTGFASGIPLDTETFSTVKEYLEKTFKE